MKNAVFALGFAALSACASMVPIPDPINYKGQEAYELRAVKTSNYDYPPTDAQAAEVLDHIKNHPRDGFSLPSLAARACPSGNYRILEEKEPVLDSYMISTVAPVTVRSVARWAQDFIIACE